MNGRIMIALALAPVTIACLEVVDPLDPMVGAARAARCSGEDSDPNQDVSFKTDIVPLLKGETTEPGCGCHQTSNANPIAIDASGLDLSSYESLRAGGTNSGARIVIERDPCDSVLWQKLTPGPPFGSRMPFDGPPFVSKNARQMLVDWIAEGARDN